MDAINLAILKEGFVFSDDVWLSKYENYLSKRTKPQTIKKHEAEALMKLIRSLLGNKLTYSDLDGFFFSYAIPGISKEFDLLRISDDKSKIVNIELKNGDVSTDRIAEQLRQNRYYLRHITFDVISYTYDAFSEIVYMLDENNNLIQASIDEVCSAIKLISNPLLSNIDEYFKPSDYLVSPISNPVEFSKGEYFLNNRQIEIKNKILTIINERTVDSPYIGITGEPGTGKSLLLYDIAKELSKVCKVAVVHCAFLSRDHLRLNLFNVDVFCIKDVNEEFVVSDYGVVLVDEAQRLHQSSYDLICDKVSSSNVMCVFSFDEGQVIEKSEVRANISRKIIDSTGSVYPLSHSFRINKELSAFITGLFDQKKWNYKYDYTSIKVLYASVSEEGNRIKRFFVQRGYTFINYSSSYYKTTPFDCYGGSEDTHHIIGREFKDVVVVVDSVFYYSDDKILHAKDHPNPNYLYTQMLYQNMTRAIDKICLIIVGNQTLYKMVYEKLSKSGRNRDTRDQ